MLKADLHVHSTVSDGSDSIPELVRQAIDNQVDVLAVSDHDTLAHADLILSLTDTDIKVMAGIEISAIDPRTKTKAHILGYGITDRQLVQAFTHPLLERRHQNSLKQIEILEKNGYTIDVEALKKADGTYIYKQHIMEQLAKTGQVLSRFGESYQSLFKNGGICDFDIEYLDVFEAVKIIRQAGGQSVLAHSGQQNNFYLIDQLVLLGLNGLEYNHPENGEQAKEIIRQAAQHYGLYLTGGSDYHGSNERVPRTIGSYLSEESGVLALC